ncbi:vacuolar membrane-associated protein iml1, partial [Rhizopus stolonifer]
IDDPLINQTTDGRYYKDFYKVLADWETTDDWMSIIGPLKKEQLNFQPDVLLRSEDGRKVVSGQISLAYDGNVLEAINLALNPFDKHYVDRDLMRTGLSIIFITPGVGKFAVNKKLLRLTNERMTDNGIAMDLVCLSPLPLHITPLMSYMDAPQTGETELNTSLDTLAPQRKPFLAGNSPEKAVMYTGSNQKTGYVDPLYRDSEDAPTQKYYAVPHWIDCSFYHHETGRFLKQDKFKTRCKMYELQMMGIMEHDLRGVSVPYLIDSKACNPNRTNKQQKSSSSSLNEKPQEVKSGSQTSNGETYLSKSANMSSSMRRPSFFTTTADSKQQQQKQSYVFERSTGHYENYDSSLFKTTSEPRFNKRPLSGPPPNASKITKGIHSSKNSFDSPEKPENINNDTWQNVNARHKSTTASVNTWHHPGEQRRIPSVLSHSQQFGGKGPFDTNNVPPRKEDRNMWDSFKASPTFNGREEANYRFRSIRRGTMNSMDGGKYNNIALQQQNHHFHAQQQHSQAQQQQVQQMQQAQAQQQPPSQEKQQAQGQLPSQTPPQSQPQQSLQITNAINTEEDEYAVVSSSTVDPVPINNKGLSSRSEFSRKPLNHSPRQGMISGSLPSIHKQSGNSDLMRTSFGGAGANNMNRSSPSHNFNRCNPYKHMLFNPCNPIENQNLFTSHLRRWQHALPKAKQQDGPVVHWKSLTTPACLPLTTDYFPSNEELARRYNHYMYTVSASEDTNLYQAGDRNLSEHKKTENLLIEMLSQRLAQGFQIIVDNTGSSTYSKPMAVKGDGLISALGGGLNKDGSSASAVAKEADNIITMMRSSGSPSNNNNAATTLATTMAIGGSTKLVSTGGNNVPAVGKTNQDEEKSKWKNMIWWLSMGHQVHQLTFDSSGQNVEVRRYVQMIQFDVSKVNYKCAIWPKNMPTYRPKNIVFNYPSLLYAWNYLDHLVAGYQEELTDNLRFWRARFIVIPRETLPNNITFTGALHDHLDEEEKRIALFESWIQNIRKAKWLTPEEREELQKRRKKEIGFSDLGVKLTTMDPSAYVASDVMKLAMFNAMQDLKSHNNLLSSIIVGQGLTRDSKSRDIALALQDPKSGIKIMDRRWHFRIFNDVFTGTEFVDWIIAQIEDISTREQAVQFGNSLMQRKPPLFISATKRHNFLDGNYFYALHEEFAVERKKSKLGRKAFMGNHDLANKEREHSDHTLHQVPSIQSTTSVKRIEFPMSRSMIIDVDPYKKSDRRETAILHYDTIHNPNNCYHFQLNWLGCTAQLVQELLQNWSRQAERCGLKLVEGSVDQAYEDSENDNPFQCPVPISMAVPPPSVDELLAKSKINVPAQFYEIALVRHLQFVLDVEADFNFERAKEENVDLEYSYIKEVYKYDQYIHQSGVAFVQIRPEGQGFYWVNNRLYTNHTPALIANRRQPSSQQLCHPDALRIKFQEHCADAEWLTEFWEKTKAHFLRGLDPNGSDAWVFENYGAIVEPTEDESVSPLDIPSHGNIALTVSSVSSDNHSTHIARSPSIQINRSPSLSESIHDHA